MKFHYIVFALIITYFTFELVAVFAPTLLLIAVVLVATYLFINKHGEEQDEYHGN